ncbi:MAG: hypothetical protein ABIQ70_08775 [Dokdonella sp.]
MSIIRSWFRYSVRHVGVWVALVLLAPITAHAALTVTPLTWNVVGLDSNSPASGPKNFPVGARVCSDVATTNVTANFVFDNTNANVNLRAGSLSSLNFATIGAGSCADAYFEVEVTQVAAAYDTTRRYHITANDITGTYSTPTPRELYVEHLISQSRNSITNVRYGTTPANLVAVGPGGALNLIVGNTYLIELSGGTATQGYEQFEAFINFSNTVFQILSVNTTYSADSSPYVANPSNKLYADACLWENDPNSPNYRSCVGVAGKAGGSVVTTYTIKIVGGGGSAQTLNTLLHDFSGSSFHYNADFSVGARIGNIIDPTSANISKSFSPNPAPVNGISALTITLTNPNAGALGGYNFVDNLPANLIIATPPGATTSGCGTPTLVANAGAGSITFSNGTVAANGSCVIKVNVTPTVTGSLVNTTNSLFIDAVDTGHTATATLTVNTAPPPGPGICGLPLATWRFPTAFNVNAPVPSTGSGSAAPGAGLAPNTQANSPTLADGTIAWGSNGGINPGAALDTTQNDYFEFAVNTTGLTSVAMTLEGEHRGGNGPTGIAIYYATTNTRPETGTLVFSNANITPTQNTFVAVAPPTVNLGLNPSGNTFFRVYFFNSGNQVAGSDAGLDNVVFSGCSAGTPATIAKAFAPNPIAVNGVSTLSFALANSNSVALTGAAFTDALPAGTQVAAAPAATTTCGGVWAPTAGATSLTFTGGTIPASSSCTVSVNVTATTAGPHSNVSGFLSTTQTGTNTNSVGSATLTALSPPQIAKQFAPSPILAGGVSRLTFTIVNPNPNDAIASVAFADTLPGAPGAMLVAAAPNATTTGCGAPTFAPAAGAGSLTFSAGAIAAGGTCVVGVDVTAPTIGTYNNTSGPVSFVINAQTINGNTASSSLVVNPPHPSIALLKQVGPSATGPWTAFLAVNLPANVFYQFTIENSGDVPLSPVTLNDPQVNTSSCTLPSSLPVAVAANNNHIVTCVAGPVPALAGSHTNTATASGTSGGNAFNAIDSATYATAAMTLAKSVTQSSYTLPGDVLNYSYLVTNNGFATLAGPITVTDDRTTVSCPALTTIGDLDNFFDPGESLTCTSTYTIIAADISAASVTNNAFASSGGTTSNTDSRTVPLSSSADVSVVKTLQTAGPYVVGQSLTYTLFVANAGPSTATSVQVTDTPTNLTITTVSGGGCAALPCTIASLAPGANITITATATINAAGVFDNSSTVTAAQPDPNPANNTDNTGNSGATGASADLSITKTDGVATATPGGSVTYTITASNAGPSAANGAIVADAFPAAITSDNWTCVGTGGGTCTASGSGNINDTVNLPSGASVIYTVTANISASATGTLSNTGMVTAPAGVTDPTPGNNSATDTDTLNPSADLAVSKTDGTSSYTPGSNTTYTILATNNGPSAVTGATIADIFGASFTSDSWSAVASGGATGFNPSGSGNINDTVNMPVGSSITYTVTATTSLAATGNLSNTATITAPAGVTDPTPGNNSATDTDTNGGAQQLSIAKSATPSAFAVGQSGTYSLLVSNTGTTSTAGPITATDPLPAGITTTAPPSGASWDCSASTATQISCTTATVLLPGGNAPVINAPVTIAVGTASPATNTATVTGGGDATCPVEAHCASTISTPVDAPLLDVTKSLQGSLVVGVPTNYLITATNNGQAATLAGTITDTIPTGLTIGILPGGCSAVGQNLTCTLPPGIATGGSISYTIPVTPQASTDGTNVSNTATNNGGGDPSCPAAGHCNGTVTNTVTAPQLQLVKSAAPTSFVVNQPATYSLTLTNVGSAATTATTTITDTIPGGLTIGTLPAGCAAVGQTVSCTIAAPLNTGAPVTFAIPVTPTNALNGIGVTNTAGATGGGDPGCPTGTAVGSLPARCVGTVTTSVNAPQLTISKGASSSAFVVGVGASYTLTVTNTGSATTTASATVTDVVPADLTIGTLSGGCSAVGQQVTCTIAAGLATGGSASFVIPVTPTAAASGTTLTNTATVSGGGDPTCPTTSNCSSTVTTPVDAPALQVLKSASGANFVVGVPANYTITVTNIGTAATTALTTVTDNIPSTLTIGALPGGCSATGQTVTCTIPANLPTNSPVSFVIPVTPQAAASGTSLSNTVSVSGGGDPSCPAGANCVSTVTTPVAAPALQIVKSASNANFVVGVPASYTLQVTNTGSAATTALTTVTDNIPGSLTIGTLPGGCSATGQQVTCTIAAGLATNSPVSFVIPVTPTAAASGTTLTNTANVAGGGDPTCPGGANCTSTVTTPVAVPALQIIKSASSGNFVVGVPASYTLIVTNIGSAATTAISTITDNVPSTLTLGTLPGGCSASGQTVTCTIATGMATGSPVSFVIPVTPTAAASGTTLANTATVIGGGDPSCPSQTNANCSSTVDTPVDAPALQVVKTASNNNFVVGTPSSYTFTVTNIGSAATTAPATVSDNVPGNLTIGSLPGGCSASGQSVTCTIAAGLATNASVSFVIPVTPTAAAAGTTLTNTATVSGGGDPSCPSQTNANCSSTVITPVNAPALQIVKSASSANFVVGVSASYTLQVTNIGSAATTAVATVTDNIPGALTIGTLPGGCSASGQTVTCPIAAGLATGSPVSFVIPVTPTAAASGTTLANTATVIGGGDPSCPSQTNANCSSTVDTPVDAPALQIVKTASSSNFVVGMPANYTLTVTNIGGAATTAVASVTDNVPNPLTIGTLPVGCNATGQQVTCTIAAGLATNAPVSFVIPVTPTAAASGTTLNNTAVISGGGDPSCPSQTNANCSSTVITPVNAPALQIVKSASSANFVVGVSSSYTLQVTNIGSAATTVVATVTDNIPSALTIGTLPGGCSVSGQTVTCTIAAGLATGSPVSFVIAVTPTPAASGTTLANTATVSGGGDPSCPGGANCSSTVSTPVGAPALQIIKTASSGNFVVGTPASYTLTVTNIGSAATTATATVSDSVPSALTIGTLPAGCGATGQQVTCTIAAGLAINASVAFTIPVTATSVASGTSLTNTATVSGGGDPSCPSQANARCSSGVITPVNAPALQIVKTASSASFAVGTPASYALTVTNIGSVATTATASVTDNIPSTLTLGTLPGGCSATGQQLTCTIAAGLAVNSSVAFTIPVTPLAAAAATTLTNTGVVSGGGDPTCPNQTNANCSSSVITPVLGVGQTSADLRVLKSGPASVVAGNEIVYTISMTNQGPDPATNATVTDPGPSGLSFVSSGAPCPSFPCNLGTLAVGQTVVIPNVTFTVPADYVGNSVVNVASATSDLADPTPDNNSSTISTPVTPGVVRPAQPVPVDARWAMLLIVGLLTFTTALRRRAQR